MEGMLYTIPGYIPFCVPHIPCPGGYEGTGYGTSRQKNEQQYIAISAKCKLLPTTGRIKHAL